MADQTMNDKVSQVSGGQADRVAAIGQAQQPASMDLINQLVQLQQQQEQLNQAPQASMQNELTSLPGILAMLGSGAAAAFGGEQGREAGAGLMQGFMGARQGEVAAHNENLASQKATLSTAMDKQRARLIQLLQTQPDMFIDPTTGQPAVDPRLLGYAATGFMIPIDPTTNHALKSRVKTKERQFEIGKELFLKGDTADLRASGLEMIGTAHGIQWSDEMYRIAASGNEQDAYLQVMREGYFTPTSVFAAMLHAQQTGKSIVEVADQFVQDDTRGADGSTMTLPQATLVALADYGERLAANPQLNDPSLSFAEKVELAFPDAGDAPQRTLLIDKFAETGISPELLARQMESSLSIIMTLEGMGKLPDSMVEAHGIKKSDENWAVKLAVQFTEHMGPALKSLEKQNAARNIVTSRQKLVSALMAVPEFNEHGTDVINAYALNVVLGLTKDLTSASGVLDYKAFDESLTAFTRSPSTLGSDLNKFLGVSDG